MSAEITADQVRDDFLSHMRTMVEYWVHADLSPDDRGDVRRRVEGMTFSILAALDGCAGNLPKFIVAPDPHPDDRQFRISEDEDWYPENHGLDVKADISGGLHENFYSKPIAPETD